VFLKVGIYAKVIGNIPQLRIPITTPPKVIIDAVQDFVPKQELNLLGPQHLDKAAIVIEAPSVSGSSGAPLVGINHLETSSKVAKEAGAQQHANSSSNQHLANFAIYLGISWPYQGRKFLGIFFGSSGPCCGVQNTCHF
jgi:hypothetical protein